MDKLLSFIKEKYPQNANDISESFELLETNKSLKQFQINRRTNDKTYK